MGSVELDRLVRTGQLKDEPPEKRELEALLHSGEARLKDASNGGLALESRFDLAYNTAHSLSLAALRFHGYRSENRYLVFQTLAHTVGLAPEQWRVLDDAHRRRNAVEYEDRGCGRTARRRNHSSGRRSGEARSQARRRHALRTSPAPISRNAACAHAATSSLCT